MPFAPEFTTIFTDIIKPALDEAGYEVSRADTDINQERILRKIIKGITGAKLVIAELTSLNPNVLYELGLSHGLRVPTVLLAQSIDEVPFDLRSHNIQLYSTHFSEVPKLGAALKEIALKHLSGDILFDNPVADFAPERVPSALDANPNTTGNSILERETADLQEEKGILEATQASQELATVMFAIVEEINNSVNKVSPLLTRFDEASRGATPGKTRQAQNLAKQMATELDKGSLRIEKYLPEIENNVKTPFQVLLRYLTLLDPEDEHEHEQLRSFREMFGELLEKMPLALRGLKSYRNSVAQIGLRSGTLGPASRRNQQAVEKITSAMEQIQAYISRTIQVIEERTTAK
jgi:hypothetical protein